MTLNITSIEPEQPFRSIRNIEQQRAYVASLPVHSTRRAKEQHVLEMMLHVQLQNEVTGFAARREGQPRRELAR